MNERKSVDPLPRLLGRRELQAYLGLGATKATRLGDEAGARINYGKRVLYDRKLLDQYIDRMNKEA